MTKDQAKYGLIEYGPEWLEDNRPLGISFNECVEAAVNEAEGEELDLIGKHFGLTRHGGTPLYSGRGMTDPETDRSFAERIMDYSAICVEKPKTKQHSHNWKSYQGLIETYEYCTICDEKRK